MRKNRRKIGKVMESSYVLLWFSTATATLLEYVSPPFPPPFLLVLSLSRFRVSSLSARGLPIVKLTLNDTTLSHSVASCGRVDPKGGMRGKNERKRDRWHGTFERTLAKLREVNRPVTGKKKRKIYKSFNSKVV